MHLNRVAGVEEPSLLSDTKAPIFIAHGEE
jgi:hypothetical protein